jgi:hypothetical protein
MIRHAPAIAASALALTLIAPAPSALATRTLTAPATASFGATLDGTNKTVSYPLALTATVTNPSTTGWNLTIRATQLKTASGSLLPQPSVTSVAWACQTTCTSNPTNSIGLPVAVPLAAPAIKFFNAAANTGMGTFTVTPTLTVTIPANARAGTYTSRITTAIVAGP